jgi:hypothetical protein
MRRITVGSASQGTGGQAKQIGEIDDTGATWSNGPGQLRCAAAQQLLTLLGGGHMESRLELLTEQQELCGHEISKVGRVLEFTYAAALLAKEPAR